MEKKDRSIVETMKGLCSTDEKSLGGAIAALNKRFADADQRIRERLKEIRVEVQAKVDAARRRVFWGFGSKYLPRLHTPPPPYRVDRLAPLDEVYASLDKLGQMRREFDKYHVEPLDPSVYNTLDDVTRLTDELRSGRTGESAGEPATSTENDARSTESEDPKP